MMSAIASVMSSPPAGHRRAGRSHDPTGSMLTAFASVDVLERGDLDVRQLHAGRVVGAVTERDLVEVLLVVVLGEVELGSWRPDDLGLDLAVPGSRQRLLVHRLRCLGRRALGVVAAKDVRPVLRPAVIALTHALRRVVVLPEDLEQILVADLRGIEDHADRLRVARLAGAGLAIGRVAGGTALVTDGRRPHAGLLPVRLLLAPEAAERKLRDLEAVGVRTGDGCAEDGVVAGLHDRFGATGQGLGRGWDRLGLVREELHGRSLCRLCVDLVTVA